MCSSGGEHYVDIVGVTGSIPVTPTTAAVFVFFIFLPHVTFFYSDRNVPMWVSV